MRIGHTLAERFVIERLAGSGGMGEVYRALDRTTGQPVAVKILHTQRDAVAARFEREARILAGIDHPSVVRYVAHGALPTGEPYLVMEWLDGEDLAARLGRERLSVADSVALAAAVAEALGALHEQGIVHRDLKPGNIFLVDQRGHGSQRIKLLDFGIAWVQTSTRMTETGALIGTVAYMAPEQARGAAELDARVDVFALGCVLFECLTGEPPFSAEHATAILTRILFEEAPRLGERLPGAPAALEALCARMLAKQTGDRPRDGRAAAQALREIADTGVLAVDMEDRSGPPHPHALTDSEQRAVAVILLGAPTPGEHAQPPQDWQRAITLVPHDMDLLAAVALEHGGRLQQMLDGSAAVLVSGAQVATDLAAQAARCALALGRHVPGWRIALAMGRGELSQRLPVGPAIDRAARLLEARAWPELAAEHALVMIDEATVGLLDARFDVREASGVLWLHGERDIAEVRTLCGKPTPCVGRERELRMLEGLFDDCVAGSGAQAVLVTAPPGVGKSRLGHEFLQKVRMRGEPTSTWIARGESLRAGSAQGLLAALVQSACGLGGGEPLEVRQRALAARVGQHEGQHEARDEAQRVAEFLGELIGASFPDEHSLPLRAARRDAQLMSDQIRAAFLDFLAAACAARPVLILLEDLHWGDGATVRLLDRALRDLEDRPLFVLALARPEIHEVFPGLWADRPVQEIRLRELPRRAAELLARHVLGERAGQETIAQLVRLSEGNAFYLEELIRATAGGKGHDLPETVVAMVQSRIGALDDESRRILRAASVFGGTFWAGGVKALVGGTARTTGVLDRLGLLVEQELIVASKDSRFPGEEEYAFRHALMREGSHAMLTAEDLMLGHRLAGEWLEEHGEDDPLVLAEHFDKGGDGARAGSFWLRAAERAGRGGDTPGAFACLERGLVCPVLDDVRIGLLGMLCEAHFFRIDMAGAARPHAEELLLAAEPGSAPWAQALTIKLICAAQARNTDDVAAALHQLMAAEIQPEAVAAAAVTLGTACYLLEMSGHGRRADAVFERLEALAQPAADRMPGAAIHSDLAAAGRSVHTREDPWTGLVRGRCAMARARAIGHRRYLAAAHVLTAANAWFLGAYDEAKRLASESRLPDDELSVVSAVRPFMLAWMLADLGEPDEAREWAERLVASGTARALPLDQALGRWALAEVLWRTGELPAADAEIQAAVAVLAVVCPLEHPGALATLAALRRAQGRLAEALAAAEEGMARYEAMGACSQFFRGAFLRLVHAECLAGAGKREAACVAIARAGEHLMRVAGKIDDPAYRPSFLDSVPENRRILELGREWLGE